MIAHFFFLFVHLLTWSLTRGVIVLSFHHVLAVENILSCQERLLNEREVLADS